MPQPNRLLDLDLDEISLVDRGADQDARVVLFKRQAPAGPLDKLRRAWRGMFPGEPVPALLAKADAEADDAATADDTPAGDVQNDADSVQDSAADGADQPAEGGEDAGMTLDLAKFDVPVEVFDYVQGLQGQVADLSKRLDVAEVAKCSSDCATCTGGMSKRDDPATAAISKLDPEARVLVEKALADAEQAREEVAKLQDAERLRAFVSKAGTDMAHLPGASTVEVAVILKRAYDSGEEHGKAVEQLLAAASRAMADAPILREAGRSGRVAKAGSPEAELETIAKGLQATDAGLTYEKAYTIAMERNPALYERYVDERGG